jgi:hypothetical protein
MLHDTTATGSAFSAEQVTYTPVEPEVVMPDGSLFMSWSDETQYLRVYHVAQNNPLASDENPGTEELPFRTINKAAQVVKPGECVWIYSGVYREMVQPRFSGEGPSRMITYQAAPGEHVIISGSRLVETGWERSHRCFGSGAVWPFSKKLWMTTLPDELFEDRFNPFATPNATDEEMDLMPWAVDWKGRLPYTLSRGMLFENGRRMQQLATYEDLVKLPGSYWVAPEGRTVHINPYCGGDPNGVVFEAAVLPHLFKPQGAGFGFIRVNGLIFEHCANGFLRTGVGAVFSMGGHHWIIENCTVRQVNSVGIEIGFHIFERSDRRFVKREDPNLGHTIVRRNLIHDCGTAGIRGLTNEHALVEGNFIADCGWQDAEFHWEVAGIKLLINNGTLVRGNRIERIQGGCGIWLDWNNRNSRVTGNIIKDVSTVLGGVFVEASQAPNMVDTNILWSIDGQGVRAADTDCLTVAHNLFWRVKEELVFAEVATDRSLGGRKLTSNDNRVLNNIFVDAARPISFADDSNTADFNVYITTPSEDATASDGAAAPGKGAVLGGAVAPGKSAVPGGDVAPGGGTVPGGDVVSSKDAVSSGGASPSGRLVQPLDCEVHSTSMTGSFELDDSGLWLTWDLERELPKVPTIEGCHLDLTLRERQGDVTVPGPFHSTSQSEAFGLFWQ